MNQLLIAIAENEIGVKEVAGKNHNKRILHYAEKAGLKWVKDDETSWCGIFLGFCVSEIPEFMRPDWPKQYAATARKWLDYGAVVEDGKARKGDIVIFWRGSKDNSWMGHCAIFMGYKGDKLLCLGGNQSDMVKVSQFSKSRVLGFRRL